jgi:hypothetical protein
VTTVDKTTASATAKKQKTGGRTLGTPNKVTADARQAIATFVDGNAHRLVTWLDQVSNGVPKPGEVGAYLVLPNPSKAFEMFQSVVEYHVPKLARTELVGDGGGPMESTVTIEYVRPKPDPAA